MTRPARRKNLLGISALVILLVAVAAALFVTVRSVKRAHRDLLRRETATAVDLLRQTRTQTTLDTMFPGRWRLTDELDPALDRAVVLQLAALTGKAAVYDADSWFQVGTLYLVAPSDRQHTLPTTIAVAAIVCLIVVGAAIAWWVSRTISLTTIRLGLLLATLASLAIPLGLARNWAVAELAETSSRLVQLAVQSLESVPDMDAVAQRPGGVTQLTGLDFMLRDERGAVSFSTLPNVATAEIALLQVPFTGRATADRVEYVVADVGSVRLAGLPYEDTEGSTAVVVMIALIGLLVAALPLSLARLVDEPRTFHSNVVAWTFLAPSLIHLGIFTIGPLVLAAWLSLHRWSLLDAARPLVGLANYARLMGDGAFWNAIKNTAVFTVHVPFAMAIALAIALVIQRNVRGIVFLRAILFLPTVTSLVAIAMVWQWMLHDEYGLINWLLSLIGIGSVKWLTSPSYALLSIMIMSVWMIVGYQMILFQAGLTAIPRELYDAARIDGAGPWSRFVHVTLPGLRHTLFFVLVTSVIGSFQIFGAVYVMTEGGPLHSTDVAVYHIYKEAWEFFRFGDAAAMSWILFAMIFMVTLIQFRLLEQRAEEPA